MLFSCRVTLLVCLASFAAMSAHASVQIDFFTSSLVCAQTPMQTLTLKGDNSCEAFAVGTGITYYAKTYCPLQVNSCNVIFMIFYATAGCLGVSTSGTSWQGLSGCPTAPAANACQSS
jgi:hypothetical protein